jgi:hypothetical protein
MTNFRVKNLHHDPLLEQWTVQRERFVLATLTAHIQAILFGHFQEMWLHLLQIVAQMFGLQPESGDLYENGVDATVDHLLQQLGLVSAPQIGQGDEV